MAGEQLMCVWELLCVEDPDPASAKGPQLNVLRRVTASLRCQSLRFQRKDFDEKFGCSPVQFPEYKEYVETVLRHPNSTMDKAMQEIEGICWDACSHSYNLDTINCCKDDLHRLWQAYIRLLDSRAYPPRLRSRQVNWVLERAAASLQTRCWHADLDPQHTDSATYTFPDFVRILQEQVLCDLGAAEVQRVVDELHGWLVREICMTGWMEKRTRKFKATWKPWRRRWFVLTPGKLEYFENGPGHVKKGEFELKSDTIIKAVLRRKTSLTGRRTMGGFCLTDGSSLELELSPPDMEALKNWLQEIKRVMDATARKTTPVREVLTAALAETGPGVNTQRSIRRQHLAAANHVRVESGLPELPPSPKECREGEASFLQLARLIRTSSQSYSPTEGLEHGFLWHADRLQDAFREADRDSAGALDRDQFVGMLKSLGLEQLNTEQLASAFDLIAADGQDKLEFSSWLRHLISVALGTTEPASHEDVLLLSSMTIFTSYIYEMRRQAAKNHTLTLVSQLSNDNKEGSSFSQLFNGNMNSVDDEEIRLQEIPGTFGELVNSSIQEAIASVDLKETVSILFDHWKNSFGLPMADQEDVSDPKIGANFLLDVLQQTSTDDDSLDFAANSDTSPNSLEQSPTHQDDSPRSPTASHPSRVTWTSVHQDGQSQDLKYIIPLASHLSIPVVDATSASLDFYGCSLAQDHTRNISLLYSQSLEDITEPKLHNFYLETRPTPTLMTPLAQDSGVVILAKYTETTSVIELTGFRLSPGQALFIPRGHLYSPLYRAGVWHSVTTSDSAHATIPVLTQCKGQLEGVSLNIPSLSTNNNDVDQIEFITVFWFDCFSSQYTEKRELPPCQLIVTGGTESCRYDNLRYHWWQQSWYHDNSPFSVHHPADLCHYKWLS